MYIIPIHSSYFNLLFCILTDTTPCYSRISISRFKDSAVFASEAIRRAISQIVSALIPQTDSFSLVVRIKYLDYQYLHCSNGSRVLWFTGLHLLLLLNSLMF